jgi:hypothetical protein
MKWITSVYRRLGHLLGYQCKSRPYCKCIGSAADSGTPSRFNGLGAADPIARADRFGVMPIKRKIDVFYQVLTVFSEAKDKK